MTNNFAYRVCYEYNGPSHDDPFRKRKTVDEITNALRQFPIDFPHCISDTFAKISYDSNANYPNTITVKIITILSEVETDAAVKQCLNMHDLFADKLS